MNDTPRDADGAKLCAWCGEVIRQSGIGRSKDYCRRSCRQRAYEARKQREVVVAAVAAAVVRRDSSRVETRSPNDSSRDETVPAGPPPVPAPAAPRPEPAPVRGPFPSSPPRPTRRRLLPPPPGAQRAEAPTLFETEAADGE
jgi:hypothetical protein